MAIVWFRSNEGYIRSKCGRFEIFPNFCGNLHAKSYNLHDNRKTNDTTVAAGISFQSEAKLIAESIESKENTYIHLDAGNGKSLCGMNLHSRRLNTYSDCKACNNVAFNQLPDGPWDMYARYDERRGFFGIGSEIYAKAHRFDDDAILSVIVSINKDGNYWGWQEYRNPIPSMIWPSEIQFRMCFASDYKVKEQEKKGRSVRLDIKIRD